MVLMSGTNGEVKIVDFLRTHAGESVVTAVVLCEDAAGKQFTFPLARFTSEMSPYNKDQNMTFAQWSEARFKIRKTLPRWKYNFESEEELMRLYLDGVAYDNQGD